MNHPAAQIIISIIPIVGIVMGAVVVFFFLLWHHKEKLLMIKTGIYKPLSWNLNVKVFSLLLGLLLTGIGIALTLIFALIDKLSYALLGGLIPAVIGIMLLIFYAVYTRKED